MVKRLLNALFAPRMTVRTETFSHSTSLQLPEHPNTRIELKRTHRKKTVAFRVRNNQIQITAPKRLALYRIQQLLLRRSDWIGKQLEFQAAHSEEPAELIRQYIDGERIHYLGRRYRLAISSGDDNAHSAKLYAGQLRVTLANRCLNRLKKGEESPAQNRDQIRDQTQDHIRHTIGQWYQQRAEERLPEIVAQIATTIGVNYGAIEIRHFKSRWGSCRADGRLQFNWRLMMASSEVIEYVVIHELCHRIHLNHSRAFWGEVEKHMPDYKQHRKWLKTDGHLLTL